MHVPPDSASAGLTLVARRAGADAFTLVAAVCMAGGARLAVADANINPYGTVTVEHNSNVFGRPDYAPPLASSGIYGFGDTIERYLAGVSGDYAWSQERLTLTAEGRHDDYDRFTPLNHNEYRLQGELAWNITSLLGGTVSFRQAQYMAPLIDTLATQISLNKEKIASALVHMSLTPVWRIDLTPGVHELEAPLPPQYPDFHLRDKSAAATLNYLGISKLTAGLEVAYATGRYYGIVDATRFHTKSASFRADYAVTGFSSFSLTLGYTQRSSSLTGQFVSQPGLGVVNTAASVAGTTVGTTGSLSYRRNLSEKTAFTVRAFRDIQSYFAGANPEVETGGAFSLTWNPDIKFSFALDYTQTRQVIPGVQAITDFADREDHSRHAALGVKYFAFSWLTVRPYLSYDKRDSNLALANYSATMVGIDFAARWLGPEQREVNPVGLPPVGSNSVN